MRARRSAEALRARYGVPDEIELRAEGRAVLAYLPACEAEVRRVADEPDGLPRAGLAGRAALGRLAADGGPLLVRPYRKGGQVAWLRGRRFCGALRPLGELALHRRLRALGVPVVEAVGAVVLRGPLGWSGHLLTREVEGAVDLEAWLYGASAGEGLSPAETLRRAGRSVRALHDAGVSHADLHPKNLLVTPAGEVRVLDLDRARAGAAPLDEGARLVNLVRLGRAVEKHRLKGMTAGRRAALRFLEGYAGGRAVGAAWLERSRARLRRGLGLRRLWWRLRGEIRPDPGRASRAPHVREAGP